MRKSSINFKKAKLSNLEHNDRTVTPSYVIDNASNNICSNDAKSAAELVKTYYDQAKKSYLKTYGQKLQAKSYLWEAVINLDEVHSKNDIDYTVNYLVEELGFQLIQYASHRDEGYINDEDEKIFNYHLHIVFFTLDLNTGRQLYRLSVSKSDRKKGISYLVMNKERLSDLQYIVANLLGMPRGKKGSKRIRLEHKAYREKIRNDSKKQKELKRAENILNDTERVLTRYHQALFQILEILDLRDLSLKDMNQAYEKLIYLISLDKPKDEIIIKNNTQPGGNYVIRKH